MRRYFIFLFFAIQPCGIGGESSIPAVLFTRFRVEPSAAVVESIREELAAIMSPIGFQLDWMPISSGHVCAATAEVVVVTFKGHCEFAASGAAFHDPSVLGLTHVSDGHIIPFSEVDCDAVRALVQRELMLRRVEDRERLFARAIARVLAHELYHVFAKTPEHGSHGISKAAYGPEELLADKFRFEKEDAIVLRKRKPMPNLENAANAARIEGAMGSHPN